MTRPQDEILHRMSSCDGKKRFRTFNEAERIIRRRETAEPMRPYRCRYCTYFHIGPALIATDRRRRISRRKQRCLDLNIEDQWDELIDRAAFSPHGSKRKRQADLTTFVHDELKREVRG